MTQTQITKDAYNYLLPALRNYLYQINNKYFFVGNEEQTEDMKNRLVGLAW